LLHFSLPAKQTSGCFASGFFHVFPLHIISNGKTTKLFWFFSFP
jgi:hypothetical protein